MTLRVSIAGALLMGFLVPLRAQPPASSLRPPASSPHAAIVLVGRADSAQPGASFQSVGTLIDVDAAGGTILSCAHTFEAGGGACFVDWGDGRHVPAQLVGLDHASDLAVLRVAQLPRGIRPIPLAEEHEHPAAGQHVELVGHGGGQWRYARARCETTEDGDLRVAFRPISGDSGGPVLVNHSTTLKLCAVIHGGPTHDFRQPAYATLATHAGPIRRFLARLGIRLRRALAPIGAGEQGSRVLATAPRSTAPPSPVPLSKDLPYPVAYDDAQDEVNQTTSPQVRGTLPAPAGASAGGAALPPSSALMTPQVELGEPSGAAPPGEIPGRSPGLDACVGGSCALPPPTSATRPLPSVSSSLQPPASSLAERAGLAVTTLLIGAGSPAGLATLGGVAATGCTWWLMRRGMRSLRRKLEAVSADRQQLIDTGGVVERSDLKLQRVPTVDESYNLLLKAMAKEAEYRPEHAPVVERIQSLHRQYLTGRTTGEPLRERRATGSYLGWRDEEKVASG